jgi:exosome complex exonuclease RRP6
VNSTVQVTHKEEEEKGVEEEMGMQVEIPFVPAAQRQAATVIEEKERDTIVVVGKPKTKKRKRTKSTVAPSSQVVDKGIALDGKESEEGFDFASVSNVLDENPEVEAKKPMKKRQKKRKGKSDAYPFMAR